MSTVAYVPQTFPRRWLPADAPLTTWEQIEPWYRRLLDRPIDSARVLEDWLFDVGELNGAVGQEGVKRYIAMTCQTDDPEREAAYLAFVREIEPKLKPIQNEIRAKYLDSPHRAELPRDRYHVFDRAQANRRALFREANIPRETELAELEQQYQKIIGAMTVTFRGEERTPAQMAPFLEENDRSVRQTAWELVAERRLAERDTLDDALRPDGRAPRGDRARGGLPRLRRLRLPVSASGSTTACGKRSTSTGRSSGWWSRWPTSSRRSVAGRWGSRRSGRGTWRSTPWAGRR